jgi:hypothetical protein
VIAVGVTGHKKARSSGLLVLFNPEIVSADGHGGGRLLEPDFTANVARATHPWSRLAGRRQPPVIDADAFGARRCCTSSVIWTDALPRPRQFPTDGRFPPQTYQ